MADTRNIHRLKSISVDEDRLFATIADVMNSCFGKTWSGFQQGFIPLNDGSGYTVWFPAMAKKRGDRFVPFSQRRGWLNQLSDDGRLLIEEHETDPRTSISEVEMLPRYVFGHYEDGPYRKGRVQVGEKGGYRFLGTFQMDLEKSRRGHREFRKISDRADLRRYAGTGIPDFQMPGEAETKVNTLAAGNRGVDPSGIRQMRMPACLLGSLPAEINEDEDEALLRSLRYCDLSGWERGFKYKGIPQSVKEAIIKDGVRVYPRDRQRAMNALSHAGFACEIDGKHPTFLRKYSDCHYTEPHHLVPLAFQNQFEASLDVEENIVSLCSNCHSEIHYGRNGDRLIRLLYEKRREVLLKAGIHVTLDGLLFMYGY